MEEHNSKWHHENIHAIEINKLPLVKTQLEKATDEGIREILLAERERLLNALEKSKKAIESNNYPMPKSKNEEVKPQQPTMEGFKYCSRCGAKIGKMVRICSLCGAKQ